MNIDVDCNVETCKNNKDGECSAKFITICEGNCMTIDEEEEGKEKK